MNEFKDPAKKKKKKKDKGKLQLIHQGVQQQQQQLQNWNNNKNLLDLVTRDSQYFYTAFQPDTETKTSFERRHLHWSRERRTKTFYKQ